MNTMEYEVNDPEQWNSIHRIPEGKKEVRNSKLIISSCICGGEQTQE